MRASAYEHLCHLLTLAYPEPYRSTHGAEIVGVLLDADDRRPGTWRRIREVGGVVVHAAKVRVLSPHVTGAEAAPRPWHLAGMLVMMVLAVVATQAWTSALVRLADAERGDGWLDPRWPVHAAWLIAGVMIWARRPAAAWAAMLVAAVLVTAYPVFVATGIPWPAQVPGTWGHATPADPSPGLPLTARDAAWWGLSLAAVAMTATPRRLATAVAALPRFAVARAALISAGLAAVTGLIALADAAVNHSYWFTAEHVRTSPLPAFVVLAVLAAHLRVRAKTGSVVLTFAILALASASAAPSIFQLTAVLTAAAGGVALALTAHRSIKSPARG